MARVAYLRVVNAGVGSAHAAASSATADLFSLAAPAPPAAPVFQADFGAFTSVRWLPLHASRSRAVAEAVFTEPLGVSEPLASREQAVRLPLGSRSKAVREPLQSR